MSIKRVTQLELENFAQDIQDAEEADGNALVPVDGVRAHELLYQKKLIEENKMTIGEGFPSWADKYQEYLNAGIRGRIAAYIAWATMPPTHRWPKTQEELAKEVLGLTSDRVIATWRKKYPEIDMMIASAQAEAMLEYRPGAFRALGEVANDPSYRANPDRKLFFEMTGDYTPRQKIQTDDGKGVGKNLLDRLKKLSTAQLVEALGSDAQEIMKELEDELRDRDHETPADAGEEKETE